MTWENFPNRNKGCRGPDCDTFPLRGTSWCKQWTILFGAFTNSLSVPTVDCCSIGKGDDNDDDRVFTQWGSQGSTFKGYVIVMWDSWWSLFFVVVSMTVTKLVQPKRKLILVIMLIWNHIKYCFFFWFSDVEIFLIDGNYLNLDLLLKKMWIKFEWISKTSRPTE